MTVRTSLFNKLCTVPKKVYSRVHERGLGDAFGWLYYQFEWRFREWWLGAKTSEFAHGVVVEDHEEQHGYEPIDYRCFDQILEYLQPISPADGFLDYGCGMGRALILAGMQPFGKVLGVEYDPKLVKIGKQQLQKLRSRGVFKANCIEILEQDATQYEVPSEINIVFLFNSFTGLVLQQTLEQIRSSLERHPRKLKLIYLQPSTDENPILQVPWLRHESNLPTGYWTHIRSLVYVAEMPIRESN